MYQAGHKTTHGHQAMYFQSSLLFPVNGIAPCSFEDVHKKGNGGRIKYRNLTQIKLFLKEPTMLGIKRLTVIPVQFLVYRGKHLAAAVDISVAQCAYSGQFIDAQIDQLILEKKKVLA